MTWNGILMLPCYLAVQLQGPSLKVLATNRLQPNSDGLQASSVLVTNGLQMGPTLIANGNSCGSAPSAWRRTFTTSVGKVTCKHVCTSKAGPESLSGSDSISVKVWSEYLSRVTARGVNVERESCMRLFCVA